jgi:hypothetical protein
MAKQKTKLGDFFEGKRRQCRLADYHTLKDEKDHLRLKLMVEMPLTGQPQHGIHDQFAEPFLIMVKKNSACNQSKVNALIDSAEVGIFTTGDIKNAVTRTNGASLQDFQLVAKGHEEKRSVALHFTTYIPFTEPLKQWVLDLLHKDFFMEVVPAQMKLEDPKDPPVNKKKKPEQVGLLN